MLGTTILVVFKIRVFNRKIGIKIMCHQDYVNQALSHFSPEQLKQIYVDTTVDLDDQVPDTLQNILKFQSEDWTFPNHSIDTDVRHVRSVEDLISYVELTLDKVQN